jgi:hypothetical protein
MKTQAQQLPAAAVWVDATAIPFPIQMDLWYELIETV